MSKKRTFISIDLPEEIKDGIQALHKPEIRWIKWMATSNLHITLNFLGELTDARIETVKQVVRDTVPYYSAFPMVIDRVQPKGAMLWLLPEASETLLALREELKDKLYKAGIRKRERQRYRPHILIARSKNETRRIEWDSADFEPLEFEVNRINLYESQLTPGQATHILIQTFELGEVYED